MIFLRIFFFCLLIKSHDQKLCYTIILLNFAPQTGIYMNNFRNILAAVTLLMTIPASQALDLPLKSINGKQYYYYAVKRGDTLLDIARRIGVSRDDIVRYNTSAADVLRQGATLYLPYDEFKDVQTPNIPEESVAEGEGRASAQFSYKVERGETLFGICHRFGVSIDSVVALNPEANKGVKAGQVLIIPAGARLDSSLQTVTTEIIVKPDTTENVSATETEITDETEEVVDVPFVQQAIASVSKNNPSSSAPSDNNELEVLAPEDLDDGNRALTPVPGASLYSDEVQANDTVSIALILPLTLDGDAQSKDARSATEFVKGFMLALDSQRDAAWPMNIFIYDAAGKPDTISSLMAQPEFGNIDLVVSLEDTATFGAMVGDKKNNRDAYLLNLAAVQDTSYITDSRVMQYNVPHNIMYAEAAEYLLSKFDGYTPVFLISKGGRSEKIPFTDYLRAQYAELGVEPIDMLFEGLLSSKELESLSPDDRYIFIPASGSLTEFNKFARPLITLRENSADPSRIAVFGYPDWTIYRNEALENLHNLGAVIYSRFYANTSDNKVDAFAEKFTETYGAPMLELVPSQAMLGYDVACYLMTNLNANNGNFDAKWAEPYRGLQSTFMFTGDKGENSIEGTANTAVYIITFLSGDEVSVQVL